MFLCLFLYYLEIRNDGTPTFITFMFVVPTPPTRKVLWTCGLITTTCPKYANSLCLNLNYKRRVHTELFILSFNKSENTIIHRIKINLTHKRHNLVQFKTQNLAIVMASKTFNVTKWKIQRSQKSSKLYITKRVS